jgi:hypothetical protein
LRGIDEEKRAGAVRRVGECPHRVDDSHHVGDVAHGDHAHARRELGHEIVDVDAAVVGQSEIANDAARSPSEVLPREHVRRVLADSDEDLVALADVARSPCGGDEVDRFRCAAREGDLKRAEAPTKRATVARASS